MNLIKTKTLEKIFKSLNVLPENINPNNFLIIKNTFYKLLSDFKSYAVTLQDLFDLLQSQ